MLEQLAYIDWTRSGPTGGSVCVDFGGARRTTVPLTRLGTVPGIGRAVLAVPHSAGPDLAITVARTVIDGAAPDAYIVSPAGDLTRLIGLAAATLHVWASGDPGGHPAAAVAPFVAGACPRAMAEVIGTIFDPVWYLSPPREHAVATGRFSRVESRLGLSPRWDRRGSVARDVVTAAWHAPGAAEPNFFDDLYRDLVGRGTPASAAARKAGRYFVRCLLAAWIDRPTGGDRLFDIKLLFGRRPGLCGQ